MTRRPTPSDPTTLQHGSAARTEESIQEALNRIVLDAIPTVVAGLAVLYAVLGVMHWILLPARIAGVMATVAGASALLLGGFRLLLLRWAPPGDWAHPIGAAVATLILLNSLLHLGLTTEARQTTNLILLVLGVGIVFLDIGWFALILAATFSGWFWVVSTVSLTAPWIHFGFALVGAAVLSWAVLVIRIRTFRRIEELHFEDRMRQLKLETALARTEAARKGEQDAREALEDAVERLRESEVRFRRLAEATFEGVVLHQDGEIVDASSRAGELFGLQADSLVGRRVQDLVVPEHRDRVTRFLQAGDDDDGAETPASLEVEGLREDGSCFPMELSGARGGYRGRTATVTLLRDVTEKRQAEKMLRDAARQAEAANRAKSSFLANMSHELRTPLNAVIGFTNILLKNRTENLEEQQVEYLRRILSNGEHLLQLIGGVLDLSKIEAGRMDLVEEPVDLEALIRECVRAVEVEADHKDLEIEVEVPDPLQTLESDSQRLRQILLNLVGNAVKFTPEGRVTVRVVAEPDSGEPRRIEVEDTGIGIPEEHLDEIFEAFRQADTAKSRSYGGTGLGLTISRSLCEGLGYRLEVGRREGEGSTFSVVLGSGGDDETPPDGEAATEPRDARQNDGVPSPVTGDDGSG